MDPAPTLVVFLHVPSTGGSTIRSILRHQYGTGVIFPTGRIDQPDLDGITASPPGAPVRAIAGHFAFGVHEQLGRPGRYVTMLRDPVDRILSNYHRGVRHGTHTQTLEQFLARRGLRNLQTRMVGATVGQPLRDADAEMLAIAQQRLSTFAAVGVTERFDESLLLMQSELDWRRPLYVRRNANPNASNAEALPDGVRAEIADQNRYDVELHAWASAKMQDLVDGLGWRFSARLSAFRALNALSAAAEPARRAGAAAKRRWRSG